MNKKRIFTIGGVIGVIALIIVIVFGSGGANAAARHLFGGEDIRNASISSIDIKNNSIKSYDLTPQARSYLKGQKGPRGAVGPHGPKGEPGTSAPMYWAKATYNKGDTNAGAIATVACVNQNDTAISGAVQVLGLDDGANNRNTPVSSSFPGRMDWSTNAPKPDRRDGWIVQFGGNAGAVSDKAPEKVIVSALCMRGTLDNEIVTYNQSAD